MKIIFYTGNCRYLELRPYKRKILIRMELKKKHDLYIKQD